MDSMEINKGVAALLVAGIAYFVTGLISAHVVHPMRLEKPAIEIKGVGAEAAAPVAEEKLAPIEPLLASADPVVGEATFKKLCTSCHTPAEGGKSGVGPNLYGVVGSSHAHMQGFNYSPGMMAMKGDWTYEELNAWLKLPAAMVKGTRMAFAGIRNEKSRADVIVYLRTLSHNPVPLPAK